MKTKNILNKKIYFAIPILLVAFIYIGSVAFAEISGDSPESSISSNLKTMYDRFNTLGHGADTPGELGAILNRIKSATEWVPNGDITNNDIAYGKTFYNSSREEITSTGFVKRFINQKYSYNSVVYAPIYRVTLITTASGGTAASVTDNAITKTLSNNTITYDPMTGVYWTNSVSTTLDNEFSYVNGDDRINPTGASCNFNSPGVANQYCDNQDPTNSYTEDNDVSAADFCLNLELDADNADSDNDGRTGVETDWRLPTEKEVRQLAINGNSPGQLATSTECRFGEQYVSKGLCWFGQYFLKNGSFNVRCVRRN